MLMAIVPNKYLAIRSSIWTPSLDPVHWHLQSRLLQTRGTPWPFNVQLGTYPSFLLIFFKYFPFPCHSAVLHCFKYWWLFRILIWSFNFAIWCFGVLHIYETPCIWCVHSWVSIFIVIVIKVLCALCWFVVVVSFYAYLIWLELFWTSCILELDNGGRPSYQLQ